VPSLSVKITGVAGVRSMLQTVQKQIPFAMATALNTTANAVQSEVRQGLNERFTLRRKAFIENTIYRQRGTDFATKSHFQAIVRVHPERDVLAKHERGGTKAPIDGKYLMLPTSAVRRTKRDLIAESQKPRALYGKKGVFKRGDVLYKESGRGKSRRLTALYVFKRSAKIRPRLGMQDTAHRVVPQVWPRLAAQALARALSTAR
jgi:hypothetical protein